MSRSSPWTPRPRPTRTLLLPLLLLLTSWSVLTATPALAHTQLDASDPPDGARVDELVDTITLTYSLPIELLPDGIALVEPSGRTLDVVRGDDGTVVTVAIDPPLDRGTWTLSWRVLANDSHPRDGSVTIDVTATAPPVGTDDAPDVAAPAPPANDGAAAADSPAAADVGTLQTAAAPRAVVDTAPHETAGAVARVMFYLGLMAAAGLGLFKAWPHRGRRAGAHRLSVAIAAAAGLALVGSLVEAAMHVAAVSGRGLAGITSTATWRAVLSTGLGTAVVLRTAGLALLLAGAVRRWQARAASNLDPLLIGGAGLAIASFQFVGHTASAAPAVVVRTADAVHAIAAAVWIGGIVGLLLLRRVDDERHRHTVARFATAATYAVAGVAAAGVALAWVNLPDVSAIWATGYGRLLAAKLLLVGGLGAIGAYNHLVVVPKLDVDHEAAAAELGRTVALEGALVAVVVVLTALLVNTSPL